MSNRPEQDPIGHAAKFLWLFALIPVIFGSITFFLPPEMSSNLATWQRAIPFAIAALVALVGLGVWRRIVVAAWAGIVLFAIGLLGLGFAALTGESKRRGMIILALLLAWPIKKLLDAIAAMRREQKNPS
jgi:hypothetical protein